MNDNSISNNGSENSTLQLSRTIAETLLLAVQIRTENKSLNQLLETSNGALANQSAILTEKEAELVQARSDAVNREKKLNEDHNLEINRLQAEVDEVKAKLGNTERILQLMLRIAHGENLHGS
jgi:predicted membrane chloride channel (bestrophin family)